MVTEPLLLLTAGMKLSPGSNTADNPRADVSARSIWNPLEKAFLDVRVYHTQAPSNRNLKTIPRMYSHHEEQKKHAYNAQVLKVERGVFMPLVFSTSGGMGEEAKMLFKRVAAKMAIRRSEVLGDNHLHQEESGLCFDLLKTMVITLWGYRGTPSPSRSTEISELDLNIEPIP